MARSMTRQVLVRKFMESHEPSVLSVERLVGEYRLILVWPENSKTWYVKGYGEDYIDALGDLWQQIIEERERPYNG